MHSICHERWRWRWRPLLLLISFYYINEMLCNLTVSTIIILPISLLSCTHISSMVLGDVGDILQHAFQKLQPHIWYVVDGTNGFNPSVRKTLSLSLFLYNSSLQLSETLTLYGGEFRFNLRNIVTIIVSMQENVSITTSRCKFARGKIYYFCALLHHYFCLAVIKQVAGSIWQ